MIWFNHEYVWDHNAGMIPACWPQHPHLVHEIAVLADQRRRAGLDPTSSALEEWHRFGIPGFLERLKIRTKNSCDEHHATWPADARYARVVTQDRARLSGEAPPVTARKPLAPSLAPHPGGGLVDPATGEVF